MGYRSEIYIKVDEKLEKELDTLLSEHNLIGVFTKHTEDPSDGYVRYEATWLKWYEGYKDVDAVNGFIDDNYEEAGLLGIGEDNAESARAGNVDKLDMYTYSCIDW